MEVISFRCSLTGRFFSCNEFVASACLTPSRHTSYNAALKASWFKTAWTEQVRPETGSNNELFISFSTHTKSSWIFKQLTTKPNRTLWPAPPSKQTSKKPHLGKPQGCFWWNLPDLHFGMAQVTFSLSEMLGNRVIGSKWLSQLPQNGWFSKTIMWAKIRKGPIDTKYLLEILYFTKSSTGQKIVHQKYVSTSWAPINNPSLKIWKSIWIISHKMGVSLYKWW